MPDQFEVRDAAGDLAVEVAGVQSAVEESLGREAAADNAAPAGPDALDIAFLAQHDRAKLEGTVGQFMAERLAAFAATVDGTHPCFANIAAEKGESVRRFGPVLTELLAAMEENAARPVVLQTLRKGFIQHKEFRGIRNLIASPPVRSLKTADARLEARRKKSVKKCPTRPSKSDEVRPGDCPSTFRPFVCGGGMREQAERSCRATMDDFNRLGCSSIANRFAKRQRVVAKMLEETYLGFVRVRMNVAAVVAARFHGCYDVDGMGTLVWPMAHFEDRCPWLRSNRAYTVHPAGGGEPTRHNVGQVAVPGVASCSVRAYPLHLWGGKLGDHTVAVLAKLEAFGPLGGRAAFDHFWVVAPSLDIANVPMTLGNNYCYADGDVIRCFKGQEEMVASLDAHLADVGLIRPVLLGEADGKCHFVTLV